MPLDSFIDVLRRRLRRQMAPAQPERDQEPPTISSVHGQQAGTTSQHVHDSFNVHGSLNNIQSFVFNNATIGETENYIDRTISNGAAVLMLLIPYTRQDAAMDSSARYPPATCHPETRRTVRSKLKTWLYNSKREWRMIWLHGPAGTGKSVIAQTFAEDCAHLWGRLGGAYFFSRTSNRNKHETVIPSLVYQLAVAIPDYKTLIARQFANDPQLLEKAPPIQFRKLIIDPFLTLQRKYPREPIVVILDGLDECEGADAQLMIINIIAEALRLHEDLPLLWLICSRPEVHLKRAFSRIVADCGREELIIDAEYREDVERYIRDGVDKIKIKYSDFTPPDWPSEIQLKKLIDTGSGLFVLASTILGYVGDPTYANPVSQLNDVMAFRKSARAVGSRKPLAALDLLYQRILSDISPDTVLPTTWRILASFMHPTVITSIPLESAQALCNFLRLDQYEFYRALRGLHSVIQIPEPADAARVPLRFHHASFQDFLLDPNRSGKFVLDQQKALVHIAKSALFWHDIDVKHFHVNDGWEYKFNQEHKHGSLPGLTWVSTDNEQDITTQVAHFAHLNCWETISRLSWANVDEDLLSQIYNFDFLSGPNDDVDYLVNWFHKQDPSNTFVRTEPSSPTDLQLLENFYYVIRNGVARPTTFPLGWRYWIREYYFIGHGIRSIIIWITATKRMNKTCKLGGGKIPSEEWISSYHMRIQGYGWEEEGVKKYWESRAGLDMGSNPKEKEEMPVDTSETEEPCMHLRGQAVQLKVSINMFDTIEDFNGS